MAATDDWPTPIDHPITESQAKILLGGDLGDVEREILKDSCAPIFWYRRDRRDFSIINSGTLAFARTSQKTIALTARHVIIQHEEDNANGPVQLQLMNAVLDKLNIIALSERLDLATIEIDESLFSKIGKKIVPVSLGAQERPMDGRGIMLAGYPGGDRLEEKPRQLDWGLFTALGIARGDTDEQITWVPDRRHALQNTRIPQPPPNYKLGGISGGPVIGWFESPGHLAHYELSGIISQAHSDLEYVVAKRTEFIRADGSIQEPS